MLAPRGERDAPLHVAATRRRIASRVPLLADRCHRLLRLAEIGARGPDPEAALPQLEAARRSLAVFLKLTGAVVLSLVQ